MPISKTKLKNAAIAAKSAALPKIPTELLDQFVIGPMTGEAVDATSMAFKKALIERPLGAELGHHMGCPNGAAKPAAALNQRNVKSVPSPSLQKMGRSALMCLETSVVVSSPYMPRAGWPQTHREGWLWPDPLPGWLVRAPTQVRE